MEIINPDNKISLVFSILSRSPNAPTHNNIKPVNPKTADIAMSIYKIHVFFSPLEILFPTIANNLVITAR